MSFLWPFQAKFLNHSEFLQGVKNGMDILTIWAFEPFPLAFHGTFRGETSEPTTHGPSLFRLNQHTHTSSSRNEHPTHQALSPHLEITDLKRNKHPRPFWSQRSHPPSRKAQPAGKNCYNRRWQPLAGWIMIFGDVTASKYQRLQVMGTGTGTTKKRRD